MSPRRKPPSFPTTQRQQPPPSQVVVRHEQHQLHVGPLPAPEQLAAFDHVLPGLADRITRMAEGHARNRWLNDRAQRSAAIMGQIFAFIVAMTIILGGFGLVYIGRTLEGLAAVFLTIAGILAAIYQSKKT